MDQNLLLFVLIVLTFATALNLFLVLRVGRLVRAFSKPPTIPIGRAVPPFEGRRPDGRELTSADLAGQAAVLAFLSPGCPKCKEKAADILRILPAIREAGVALWIVPADDTHDIAELLGDTPLRDHVLVLDAQARLRLNPRKGAPFYVFLDDEGIVQASNYIGDEDWLSFIEQMEEVAARAQ